MPNKIPVPTPEINRLRAAAALIPIIEAGLAESRITAKRAAVMASFCEGAVQGSFCEPAAVKLAESIRIGVLRIKGVLVG